MEQPFANEVVVSNPYGVLPAQSMAMDVYPRHDAGNALAANAEARAVAEVKAQVIMARQFPRNPQYSMDNILRECKRPTLADSATYTFPRGKETVTGPSIRLAEMLARNWGNVSFGYEVLERKKDERGTGFSVIRTFAWDLETNTYISRQFELKHYRSTRSGGYAITDDRDIYELEANMASRRIRACILQAIPGDVTQAAVDACRYTSSSGLAEKMKNPKEREKLVAGTVRVYEKMGVSVSDLEEYLGAKQGDWTADSMLKLKELKNSLDDGVSTLGDVFQHLAGNDRNALITKEQAKTLMEEARKTGLQGEISDALKKLGIAKFADIPAVRYEEMLKMIRDLAQASQPKTLAEPDKTQQTDEEAK